MTLLAALNVLEGFVVVFTTFAVFAVVDALSEASEKETDRG